MSLLRMFRNRERALVLGCGPAGMFAAHAAREAGCEVLILSKKRQSHMFGAQYLHMPIPGLPERRFQVDYQLRGSREDYARKVYGDNTVPFASPDRLVGKRPAWDLRAAYDEAYGRYASLIADVGEISHGWLNIFLNKTSPPYDFIFSTIPARDVCGHREHRFQSQQVYALGDAPERNQFVPPVCPNNTVICNGESEPRWYRAARILGYGTLEWPGDKKPPIRAVAEVTKPISTDCDCFLGGSNRFYRLGRYGKWEKGILSHDAYFDAKAILSG